MLMNNELFLLDEKLLKLATMVTRADARCSIIASDAYRPDHGKMLKTTFSMREKCFVSFVNKLLSVGNYST